LLYELSFTLAETGEYPIGKVVIGVRLGADADFNAGEVVVLQVIDDISHTVLTAVGALASYAHFAGLKADIVAYNYDVFGGNLIKICCVAYCLTAEIHKGLRFEKKTSSAFDSAFAYKGFELELVDFNAVFLGENVYADKACIMAGEFILLSGVAQTNNHIIKI
jgi:hypothetical protein